MKKIAKGLRHITLRKNAVKEYIIDKTVDVKHFEGDIMLLIFSPKNIKTLHHYLILRDTLLSPTSIFTQ